MDQIVKCVRDLNIDKIIKCLLIFLILYGLFLLLTSEGNKTTRKEYYGSDALNATCTSAAIRDGRSDEDGGEIGDEDRKTTIKWTNRNGIITDMKVIFSGFDIDLSSNIRDVNLQVGDKSSFRLNDVSTETTTIFQISGIDQDVIKDNDILSLTMTSPADVDNICGNKPTIEITSRQTLSY